MSTEALLWVRHRTKNYQISEAHNINPTNHEQIDSLDLNDTNEFDNLSHLFSDINTIFDIDTNYNYGINTDIWDMNSTMMEPCDADISTIFNYNSNELSSKEHASDVNVINNLQPENNANVIKISNIFTKKIQTSKSIKMAFFC